MNALNYYDKDFKTKKGINKPVIIPTELKAISIKLNERFGI